MAKALKAFSGTATSTISMPKIMNELVICNDGAANLTFTVSGETFTLRPGYTFDEELEPFKEITVTATDAYFGYARRQGAETR
ncbi:hypothetical protein BBD42_15580 [Paenibacillus sp. BIHB 4019]|uniref:Uncharacterized protein n=1 Tax=Paenibacillus sp. BIHB 4019 TaxID=1870819 RepID=A0A1B2DJ26_9BACL|nr:hypothetical protein [Paenibacillus sp. BIHB 4019]ANY67727.1 hypothetical protein BBD42_15580 [Paenibacillus sp. BIHB 4019]